MNILITSLCMTVYVCLPHSQICSTIDMTAVFPALTFELDYNFSCVLWQNSVVLSLFIEVMLSLANFIFSSMLMDRDRKSVV